jgi:hypothetical protein
LFLWAQGKNKDLQHLSPNGFLIGKVAEEILRRKDIDPECRAFVKRRYCPGNPHHKNFEVGTSADKDFLWEKFVRYDRDYASFHEIEAQMKGFNDNQDENAQKYAEKFFEDIFKVIETQSIDYTNLFFTSLFPKIADNEYLLKSTKSLYESKQKLKGILLPVSEKLQQVNVRLLIEQNNF